MDLETNSTHSVLERMLIDENAEPRDLRLSLLEDITDQFSPDNEIGRGGFAVVYKGMVGQRMVAVKKLSKTHDIVHEDKFHKEIECLMKAKHKNIVRFLGYCVDTQGKVDSYEGKFIIADLRTWLLCFEYAPNGNLQKYITDASGGLEWSLRFRIIKGICEGLHHLHMNNIIHLDLKPANILLDGHMVPKIADFGLSRFLIEKTHCTTKNVFGTPGYMAPEYYGGKVTFASDIYSLGVIIMEILTGVKGYHEDDNVIESWMNRLEGDTQLEQVRACTKMGKECMELDPKKRPVAWRIIDMLDKTGSANETSMSSSLVEPQASLLGEQSDQKGTGKLAESLSQEDINEWPETEDVAERLVNDHSQKGQGNTGHLSSRKSQDIDRKANHKGTSILSFSFSVWGIQHLPSLVQVHATIDWKDTALTSSEVDAVEAKVREQLSQSPNNLVLELNRRRPQCIAKASEELVTTVDSLQEWGKQIDPRKLVVVHFSAKWCRASRKMSPVFAGLALKYRNAVFLKVDVDVEEMETVKTAFSVKGVPTFVFMKGDRVKDRVVGADKEELEEVLEEQADLKL